jgi:hypothetical protein
MSDHACKIGPESKVAKLTGMGEEGDGSRERIKYSQCDGGPRREA